MWMPHGLYWKQFDAVKMKVFINVGAGPGASSWKLWRTILKGHGFTAFLPLFFAVFGRNKTGHPGVFAGPQCHGTTTAKNIFFVFERLSTGTWAHLYSYSLGFHSCEIPRVSRLQLTLTSHPTIQRIIQPAIQPSKPINQQQTFPMWAQPWRQPGTVWNSVEVFKKLGGSVCTSIVY